MPKWVSNLCELYREVSPKEFYRTIFQKGELDEKNAFTKGKFTGIACEFTGNKKKIVKNGKEREKEIVRRYSITDELDIIDELLKSENFIIISPISYLGKERSTANAVRMYAFAIEIDNLRVRDNDVPIGFNDLIHHFGIELLPTPNYIVASGSGLHLYYVFEMPLILYDNVKKSLIRFKKAITPLFWNRYVTFDYEEEKIQYESPFQGFRMVGGVTKQGDRTRVFEVSDHPITVEKLNEFVREEEDKIIPVYESKLTLDKAKEQYSEWYEKRIINKNPKGSWTCKRDLYDWWRRKIWGVSVGHRYNCLFLLSCYAIKCGISRDELESDMCEYLQPYDDMSVDEKNRFTEKDIADALQAYEDKGLVTYPINSIEKRSGFVIQKNKRNYRKQKQHLQAEYWINGKGRPEVNTCRQNRELALKFMRDNQLINGRPKGSGTAQDKVIEWQQKHPNGKKADCIRETGLSKPTVYKWWTSE